MDTQDATPFQGSGIGPAGPARRTAAVQPSEDRYNMNHGNRGIAIIINNNNFRLRRKVIDRIGSEEDANALDKCFCSLGFSDVKLYNDQTCHDIRKLLRDVARMDHMQHDMLACAILTHGEEGKIYGVDDSMAVEELFAPFKDPACTLMGKPKLFIVQATDQARGTIVTDAVGDHSPDMNIQPPTKCSYRIPTEADFLIAYAPAYGIYSQNGTRFIRHLAKELEQVGSREVMQVMTRVTGLVTEENATAAAQGQLVSSPGLVPCITTMLTKDLYFV